jgi:hypothetical protein
MYLTQSFYVRSILGLLGVIWAHMGCALFAYCSRKWRKGASDGTLSQRENCSEFAGDRIPGLRWGLSTFRFGRVQNPNWTRI